MHERQRIYDLVYEYYQNAFPRKPFIPGETPIPISGKVFDAEEVLALVDSSLDFRLTADHFAKTFEEEFARYLGVNYALLTNSGSSANLLAISALTSPLFKERRLQPQDEIITLAAGFPTTVNPIIQNGLVPVFIDSSIPTYNADITALEQALSPKTKGVFFAHTLGNPFNLEAVIAFSKKHNLWLIEDCCDALGSTYKGQKVGTFGDLATFSFYPAHHITMGEGGCVITNQGKIEKAVLSFRDWGRDCWCEPGRDNTCGKRFCWKKGSLPYGYDHKYTYSHIGYNLKVTDMQAALGVAQMKKLPQFIETRKRNFQHLWKQLEEYQDRIVLPLATPHSSPSWFGFPISVPDRRNEYIEFLERHKVATRLLFGGNLLRQPAYAAVQYRKVGNLPASGYIMNHTFWVGVYPGISTEMLEYMASIIKKAIQSIAPKDVYVIDS